MYARYTEYLNDLMKNNITKQALDQALSTYPLYEGKKNYDLIPTREELNKKILNHYKYREIGFETVGMFLDELQITMEEMMPLYNERLKTVEIMAELPNPFDNVDVVEEYTEESEGTTTNETAGTNKDTTKRTGSASADSSETSTSENEASTTATTEAEDKTTASSETDNTLINKKVHSETPQDELSITSKNIDNVNYADDVEWNKGEGSENNSSNSTTTNSSSSNSSSTTSSNSNSTSNTSTTNTENVENNGENSSNSTGTTTHKIQHTFTKKGNQGVNTYAHDMIEFRTAIIDVVNEIITDKRLNELFMQIF